MDTTGSSESWLDELTVETMPNDDLREIAELIGLDAAKKLLYYFRGCTIIVPRIGVRNALPDLVRKHYNGFNARDLALKFGVSERTIYRLASAIPPHFDQPELFDFPPDPSSRA